MQAKDLTGKTFGHLKVIRQAADYVSPKGYKSKRKQYGGFRKTLPEALALREKLRQRLWPNYNKK